jgi:hypothetical protein
MPIKQQLWSIGQEIQEINEISLTSEDELEDILAKRIEILNPRWLIIGRQVLTGFNKRIDLLAIDGSGNLIVIELKKNKTSRDVVAQGIDYASWIKKISLGQLELIFKAYQTIYLKTNIPISLNQALKENFSITFEEDEINNAHQIIIVASELDSQTERIINYLSESEIPINIVFFKVFMLNGVRLISRAWFVDPEETEETASKINTEKEDIPWNGEYYVSFGHDQERSWNDAIKYGFISGGGKPWFSRTLGMLNINDRVWVNIPHTGYVGVGLVTETVQMAKDMLFDFEGEKKTVYELNTECHYCPENKNNEDDSEYIVKVNWIKSVPINQAIKELGFFGNQNTVCRPANSKWNFTIDYLKRKWAI